MSQANLFDDPESTSSVSDTADCRFPEKSGMSAYTYGCRCGRCKRAKSAANRLAHRTGSCAPTCAEPGCDLPRRRVQGAKYCGVHSTSIGYKLTGIEHRPLRDCLICGSTHRVPGAMIHPFCSPCNNRYRGIINSARLHRAPLEQLVAWVASGRCDLCERPLYLGKRSGRSPMSPDGAVVDHDHACCSGDRSCGQCIRGMLCGSCNMGLGQVERLVEATSWSTLRSYLSDRRRP